ncbi:zinc ribbon domain-containing protein [Pseudactinotalea sp. HY160]|uniref:zinc ribbon domain-containing protein n=1 Tax=Pseudactinotalea sp. HY160 TaxID=2654490 RepID=UPI00128D6A70|nr:zinc ribbon domain-containing protein [Pseudactinotalea sp. HY160]MPV48630.1 zinc ribbon domain-containing protein [Pseudactinotalea sp. HY160]
MSSPAGSARSSASQAGYEATSKAASSLGLPPAMTGRATSALSSLGRGARRRRDDRKKADDQVPQSPAETQVAAPTRHAAEETAAPAAAPEEVSSPATSDAVARDAASEQAVVPTPVAPVRPAPVQPAGVQPAVPAPVRPQAPKPRRHVEPAPAEEPPPAPGDLICGACGAGNAPHRKFCRRCGASLIDAPVQGRLSRRERRRLRRSRRRAGPTAGTRPTTRRRRFPVKTVVVLVILALAGTAGWIYRSSLATGYNVVLDRVNGNQVFNPSAATASSSQKGHGADLARNGVNTDYWAPEATGGGDGEWIEFTFDEPFRLVHVLLTSGASTQDKERLAQARPSKVRFSATTGDGTRQIKDLPVEDVGTAQELLLRFDDVTTLRMTVLSSYPPADKDPADARVAVAEVEFRGR